MTRVDGGIGRCAAFAPAAGNRIEREVVANLRGDITAVRNVARQDLDRSPVFESKAFVDAAWKNNPTISRFKTSSLHAVVEALRKGNDFSHVMEVARSIPLEKWRKYPDAKQVLLQLTPAVHRDAMERLFGKPVDFASVNMAPGAGGFIEHTLAWASSTGNLRDLNHVTTREVITWDGMEPDEAHYVLPEYRIAGFHTGLGVASGVAGRASDTHHPAGQFGTPAGLSYQGPGIRQRLEQLYQYSLDGGRTWSDFPGGSYGITRTLRSGPAFEVRKERLDDPGQAATASWKP